VARFASRATFVFVGGMGGVPSYHYGTTSAVMVRGDGVARMPVDLGEPGHTKFLGNRLSGIRARDASAHGFSRLPAKSREAMPLRID
jgi:hypothetical protein